MDVEKYDVASFTKREKSGDSKFERFLEEVNAVMGPKFEST